MYPVIGPPGSGPRPRSTPSATAEPLAIELDIPCSRCGYILRGLKTDAVCPECTAPITRSVVNNRLDACDPRYVRALHVGSLVTSLALAAQLLCTSAVMLPLIFFALFWRSGPPPNWFQATAWFTMFILPGFAAGGGLAGWFFLPMPDPAMVGPPADPSWRRVLRIVLLIEAVCWLVLVGFGLLNVLSSIPPGVYVPIAAATGLTAPFAILIHAVIAAFYFRAISPRLNTEFTDAICSWHHWAAAASTFMILLCFLAFWTQSEPFAICCVIGAYVALAALACVHLSMLWIIRVAARDAIAAQRRPPALSRAD
jgi:hypothetical protein